MKTTACENFVRKACQSRFFFCENEFTSIELPFQIITVTPPNPPDNSISRRTFVKTSTLTVGAATLLCRGIALGQTMSPPPPSPTWDINSVYSECNGTETTHPPTVPGDPPTAAGYHESDSFPVPGAGLSDPTSDLKVKLCVTRDPWPLPSNHPVEATHKYFAQLFGTIQDLTPHAVSPKTVLAQTSEWVFKGICNPTNGHIAPSDALVTPLPPSPPDTVTDIVQYASNEWRVKVEIVDKVITPPAGGSEVTLTGKIKVTWQKSLGLAGFINHGSAFEKPFKLIIASHEHK